VDGIITATGGNSDDWNTAYGWGDHSTVGYLTSYTETDPVFGISPAGGITATQISNWDTAYGWGDHALAGYDTTDDSWIGTGNVYTTSGNVGIGTTSPVTRLHVEHNIGGQWAAKVVNPSATGLGMTVDTGSSNPAYLAFRIRTGEVNRFWVVNDGTAYLAGNMGIGTQNPSEKLDVVGNIHASGTISSGSSIAIDGTHDKITASGGTIDFDNENLITTGKVGIGTASPIGLIEVKTGNTVGPPELDQKNLYYNYYRPRDADSWQSFTAGVTGKMTRLDVYFGRAATAATFNFSIHEGEGVGGTLLYQQNVAGGPWMSWKAYTLSTSIDITKGTKYTWRFQGKVPSPYSGTCLVGGDDNYAGGRSDYSTSRDFSFKTYVKPIAPELVVTSDGKVGIGTANPQGALDIYSTTGALIVPRMTTTERDAMTAVNGMIIYNSATNQFNFYENGAWVTK
jgi:hypothetical protein